MAEKHGPILEDFGRFVARTAFAVPLLFPGIAHAQASPDTSEETSQTTADTTGIERPTDVFAQLALNPAEQTTPIQLPVVETPKTAYQEPRLFSFNFRKPIDLDTKALEEYLRPFNAAKIGETTDTELAKLLGPTTKIDQRGEYKVYSLPIPASTAQELKSRYRDPARSNEIVTRDGVVFMERINGFDPGTLKRVPNTGYYSLFGHDPESTTGGHTYWGNSFNNFYQNEGLVTITSQAPEGPDLDQINEYVRFDPRKANGTSLSYDEFKADYAAIHGNVEFDYNPNK